MQNIKIRKILPSDNKTVSAIIKSVLTELNCNIKGTAYYDKETDAMYEAYQKENTIYFVAELNGEVIGGCGIGELEKDTCELQKMYILPKARGHQIGYHLLQKNIEFATKSGYKNIYLETFPQMTAAIKLYQKNGFFPINNSIGNTCHYACNVWMLKRLKKTIINLKMDFLAQLKEIYPETEIQNFVALLAEKYLKMNRVDVALNSDLELNATQLQIFYNALEKLKQQKPIQYIIGETEFYIGTFLVNENVLIPRPETEELVDWIITNHQNTAKKLRVLDIGTGSGCIAISLAKNLNATVSAIDISKEALKITQQNANRNQVQVTLSELNILENTTLQLPNKLDIIVSNPPYVRKKEKQQMQKNVLDNEPHLALFVADENPLQFYTAIADFAKINLNPKGKLYFEINEYLGKETIEMLQEKGFKNIHLKQDLFGKDRMILAES